MLTLPLPFMKRHFTIIQDDREKKPLLFPTHLICADENLKQCTVTLTIEEERLDAAHPELAKADYYVRGHPDAVVIERKGSIREVSANVLNKRRRRLFIQELAYLHDHVRRPILLFEGTPSTILTANRYCPNPEVALDALLDLLLEYRIGFLLLANGSLPARRAMGELVARLLIRGTLNDYI